MAFESGVVIFFRALDQSTRPPTLARSVHPNGRDVQTNSPFTNADDYVIRDEMGEVIGIYPREWVACILPLQFVGPSANVADQQTRRDSAPEATQGDSEGVAGRAKRFNS